MVNGWMDGWLTVLSHPRGPGEQTGGEIARVYGLIVVCFKSCFSIAGVGGWRWDAGGKVTHCVKK